MSSPLLSCPEFETGIERWLGLGLGVETVSPVATTALHYGSHELIEIYRSLLSPEFETVTWTWSGDRWVWALNGDLESHLSLQRLHTPIHWAGQGRNHKNRDLKNTLETRHNFRRKYQRARLRDTITAQNGSFLHSVRVKLNTDTNTDITNTNRKQTQIQIQTEIQTQIQINIWRKGRLTLW